MKKLILSLAIVACFANVAFSQKVNEQSFKDKITKSDVDTQDPKKAIKASTWISRGEAFTNAANAYTANVFTGMGESELVLLVGKPESDQVPIETINGQDYKHYSYPGVDLYFDMQGKLAIFMEKKAIIDGALEQAIKAYEKAYEVDPKAASKIKAGLLSVMASYRAVAENAYNLGNFAVASSNFCKAADISSHSIVNDDSQDDLNYFASVTSIQAEKYADAEKRLESLKNKGIDKDGDIYYYLGLVYQNTSKSDLVESLLIEGLGKHQANQRILQLLIGHYIQTKDDPSKVIPFIKKAQDNDPTNAILMIAEGLAYENMKDTPKAIEAYQRAVDAKPDLFDAVYNLALATYRYGGNVAQELNKIDASNQSAYKAKREEAEAIFVTAAEKMEAAYKLNPKSKDAVEVLKSIYFRLRDKDSKYMTLYNSYNDVLKTM